MPLNALFLVCSVADLSLTAKRSVKKTVPIRFNVDSFNAYIPTPKFLDINLMKKKNNSVKISLCGEPLLAETTRSVKQSL